MAQLQDEVRASNIKMRAAIAKTGTSADSFGMPPQLFIKTEIGAQDIKKDMLVSAVASSNIKDAKTFIVTEISVQVTTTPPAPVSVPVR